jgi:cytosine/adenosine deaminase-related metal-dependent hydrolase
MKMQLLIPPPPNTHTQDWQWDMGGMPADMQMQLLMMANGMGGTMGMSAMPGLGFRVWFGYF